MSRYRNRNTLQNTLKDYLVPIIGWVIILLIIFKVFSWGDETSSHTNTPSKNTGSIAGDIHFAWEGTEAFIVYPGGSKQQITDSTDIYNGETIIVKSGRVNIEGKNGMKISLNKIAELVYHTPEKFSLKSSDAWFTLPKKSTISMRYANIETDDDAILSLTQNEAGSTVYILKGIVKVSNLAGVSTSLAWGQKISVSRLNASKEDFDISGEKGEIDSFFKMSDWFLDNGGPSLIASIEAAENDEENEESEETQEHSSTDFLSLTGLKDEMSTDEKNLSISGKIGNAEVTSLTIGNKTVALKDHAFLYDIPLQSGINDIVIKLFNADKKIILKKVYTVYSSTTGGSADTTSAPKTIEKPAEYVISSRDFIFTAPSATGKFTTTSPEVTIRGKTTAKWIDYVKVNGFKLASFHGSTWRYHAFKRFETLEEGTNQYKIDYYNADGNVVYTDYFTIIKKTAASVPTAPKKQEEKTETASGKTLISDEA